jgi:hypothetical protein
MGDLQRAKISVPEGLSESVSNLYLLGPTGGSLLQLISTLRASAHFTQDVIDTGLLNADIWNGVVVNLRWLKKFVMRPSVASTSR